MRVRKCLELSRLFCRRRFIRPLKQKKIARFGDSVTDSTHEDVLISYGIFAHLSHFVYACRPQTKGSLSCTKLTTRM